MELIDEVICRVKLIDIADTARRLYGGEEKASYIIGRPLPEHDFRFHISYGDGGEITFNDGATAADVAAWLKRERIQVTECSQHSHLSMDISDLPPDSERRY